MPRLDLHFRQTGTSLSFDEQTWGGPPVGDRCEQQLIEADLKECLADLGAWDEVLRRVDREHYQRGVVAWEEARAAERAVQEEMQRAALAPHQFSWEKMRAKLEGGVLYCPHCQQAHHNIRAYNRHPNSKSIFICQTCAFSFGPDGLPEWHQLGAGEL